MSLFPESIPLEPTDETPEATGQPQPSPPSQSYPPLFWCPFASQSRGWFPTRGLQVPRRSSSRPHPKAAKEKSCPPGSGDSRPQQENSGDFLIWRRKAPPLLKAGSAVPNLGGTTPRCEIWKQQHCSTHLCQGCFGGRTPLPGTQPAPPSPA
jgi:hypothetical protein